MLAIQLKSAATVFSGKGASGLPRVAFELEVRDQKKGSEGRSVCFLSVILHFLLCTASATHAAHSFHHNASMSCPCI